MKLSDARKAMAFFSDSVTRKQQARLAVRYAQALAYLGEKHILAKQVQRLETPRH